MDFDSFVHEVKDHFHTLEPKILLKPMDQDLYGTLNPVRDMGCTPNR